jgi:hypothetical protein
LQHAWTHLKEDDGVAIHSVYLSKTPAQHLLKPLHPILALFCSQNLRQNGSPGDER